MKKIFLLILTVLIAFSSVFALTGCSSGSILYPVSPSDQDLKVVGTAGEYDILYDELRFLTLNYRYYMEQDYNKKIWEDPSLAEEYRAELENKVFSALTVNAAALKVANKFGIGLDDKAVNDYLNIKLNALAAALLDNLSIESGSNSSPDANKAYSEYLSENFLTDRYNRYTMKIDGCVESLKNQLISNGTLLIEDDAVLDYIKNNFVRTYHVFIPAKEENSKENAELVSWILSADFSIEYNRSELDRRFGLDGVLSENMTAEQKRLRSLINRILNAENDNEKMIVMVGSVFNKDTAISGNGYYFTRDEHEESYEQTAFALEIGDISNVVTTEKGYYIIQRLELEEKYINSNFENLKSQYHSAYINKLINDAKDEIAFEFNDFGKSIDLTKMK